MTGQVPYEKPDDNPIALKRLFYIFNAAESLRTKIETVHGVFKDSVMLGILTTLEDIENPYICACRTMYNIEQQEISTCGKPSRG